MMLQEEQSIGVRPPPPRIRRKIYVSRRVTRLVWALVSGNPLGKIPYTFSQLFHSRDEMLVSLEPEIDRVLATFNASTPQGGPHGQ